MIVSTNARPAWRRRWREPEGAFGTLRLLLAAIVAMFHAGLMIGGIASGVSAVVCFFMISGYAMTGLARRTFPGLPAGAGRFYRDRLLRLAPQYYAWLAVAAVAWALGANLGEFIAGPPGPWGIIGNLTVVPLDFYAFLPPVKIFLLLPPAWSLGLELTFYLAFPFLLGSRLLLWAATLGGLAVAFLAAQGMLDSDIWGYRLLPGTLPFFVLGHAIYRRDPALLAAILSGLSACALAAWWGGRMALPWNNAILAGWLIGTPLVFGLSFLRARGWDTALGNASYGCYLAHWLPMSLTRAHHGDWAWSCGVALCAAILGAGGFWLVEAPITRLRRRLRRPEARSSCPEPVRA